MDILKTLITKVLMILCPCDNTEQYPDDVLPVEPYISPRHNKGTQTNISIPCCIERHETPFDPSMSLRGTRSRGVSESVGSNVSVNSKLMFNGRPYRHLVL